MGFRSSLLHGVVVYVRFQLSGTREPTMTKHTINSRTHRASGMRLETDNVAEHSESPVSLSFLENRRAFIGSKLSGRIYLSGHGRKCAEALLEALSIAQHPREVHLGRGSITGDGREQHSVATLLRQRNRPRVSDSRPSLCNESSHIQTNLEPYWRMHTGRQVED
ncbi:hypothetical protein LX36DRAFT_91300 [Colletotrichum falcatum]|nr:hypothetical protein LX36DRAFT_91300 [Colletotrichum falcatum]